MAASPAQTPPPQVAFLTESQGSPRRHVDPTVVDPSTLDPQAQLRKDVERKLLETCHLLFEMEITAGNVLPGREEAMIEIVEIDASRNPHFVTRKYLNAALGTNQFHNAKYQALSSYHDLLTTALGDAFPDMMDDLTLLRPPPAGEKETPTPTLAKPQAETQGADEGGVKKEEP
ncbi:hypothetical protein QFC21_004158 [Naganishia friedmannii]|uniref:Uncharacterized protein n=1 Tax=Naganishia friedmannii TaxID=89922 RepID=A0ACC2VJ19_9TREE|nr:hypothetical protein QFC21_004158 [Naganishia friedmannii]